MRRTSQNISQMLSRFSLTVPIYLVKKTPSDKTSLADITNTGLIYNTRLYLLH